MAEGKTPDRQLHLERNKPKSQDGQPADSESREELVDMLGGLLDKIGDLESRITEGSPTKAEPEPEPPEEPRRRARKKPTAPSEPLAARRAKSVRSRIRPTRVGEETGKSEIEKFGMPDWRADISATGPEQPAADPDTSDPLTALERENESLTSAPASRLAQPSLKKPRRRIVAQPIPAWAKDGYHTEDPQIAPDAEPASADPIFGIDRIASKDQASAPAQTGKAQQPLTANQAEAATQPSQQAVQSPAIARPTARRLEPQKPAKKPGFFGRLFGRKSVDTDDEDTDFIEGGVPVRLDPKLGAETETPAPPPNVMLEPEPPAEQAAGPVPAQALGGPPGMVVEPIEDLTAPPRPPMAGPITPMPTPHVGPMTPPPQEPPADVALDPNLEAEPASDLSEDVEKLASTLETTIGETDEAASKPEDADASAEAAPESATDPEVAAETAAESESESEPSAPAFDRSFEDAPDESQAWADEMDQTEAGSDDDQGRKGRAISGFAEAPAVFEPEAEGPKDEAEPAASAAEQPAEQPEQAVEQEPVAQAVDDGEQPDTVAAQPASEEPKDSEEAPATALAEPAAPADEAQPALSEEAEDTAPTESAQSE
ncbi:MAG: hypothetical protein AAFW76_00980, partial [Pseudomonadota bacterium]